MGSPLIDLAVIIRSTIRSPIHISFVQLKITLPTRILSILDTRAQLVVLSIIFQ